MSQEQNKPIKKFRVGGISAAVWKNEDAQPDGSVRIRYSVSIQKRYRNAEGQWLDSESYYPNELPKLQLVLAKAYEYVSLQESEVEEAELTS